MLQPNQKQLRRQAIIGCCLILILIAFPTLFMSGGLLLDICAFVIGLVSVRYGFMLYFLASTQLLSLYGVLSTNSSVRSSLNWNDIALMAALGILVSWIAKNIRGKATLKVNRRAVLSALLLLCSLASGVLVAYIRWGQPIARSLLGARSYLSILVALPMIDWFSVKGKREVTYVFDLFSYLAVFACFLCILQYFVFSSTMFLPVSATSYGTHFAFWGNNQRFLLHGASPWMCLLCAYNYLQLRTTKVQRREHLLRVIACVILCITIIVITQTRIFIFSLLLMLAVVEFLFVQNNTKAIKWVVALIIIMFVVVFGADYFSGVMSTAFEDILTQKEDYGRLGTLDYFWNSIKDSYPLFGGGIANSAYAYSPVGMAKGTLTLSDIGGFGYFYQFGIQGCLGLICYCATVYFAARKKNAFIAQMVFLELFAILFQSVSVSPAHHFSLFVFLAAITFSGQNQTYERIGELGSEEVQG